MLLSDYEKAQKLQNEINKLKRSKSFLDDESFCFLLEAFAPNGDVLHAINISEFDIFDDLKSEISRRIEEKEKEFNNL